MLMWEENFWKNMLKKSAACAWRKCSGVHYSVLGITFTAPPFMEKNKKTKPIPKGVGKYILKFIYTINSKNFDLSNLKKFGESF